MNRIATGRRAPFGYVLALTSLLLFTTCTVDAPAEEVPRPNFVVVMVDDTAGQLGRLFGDLGALAVNVEDFRLEHSPGAPFGLAEIAVAPSVLRDATAGLEKRGWKIASTTND